MAATKELTLQRTQAIKRAVESFLKSKRLKLGAGAIYTPAEWEAKGEEARSALLVIVYDGAPDLRRVCSLDGYDYKLNAEFQAALQAIGCRFEEDTCWFGHVYQN